MSGQRNDHRIELKRLAKLRWNLPGGNVTYGSGYLVSPSVVLTAAHLVEGTEQVEIRLNPSAPQPLWQGGDVVWRGRTDKHDLEGIDLALVRLQTPTALLGIVHFAHLGSGITSHSCRGIGFPDYKLRSASSPDASDIRDTAQLEGELRLGSNVAVGQWELQLAQNPLPAAPDATSPWPGISGSAVFVGKCVVGVVIIHPQQEGTTVLQVQPIYPVLSHPEFCQHLTGEARSLYWSDPWGLLRSPYQDLPEVAEQSAAVLLQPEIGVVPFEGRQAELKSLQTWLTGDPSFRLWLQLGSGGSGKTRLISEFADWAGRRGWLSGWLPTPNEPFSLTDLQPHLASGLPLLLLLDEAHWRKTDELVSLLKQLTGENSGEKCRLVFVARTDHDWWEQLKQSTVDAIPTLLAVEGAFKHTLQSLVPYHQDQLEAYKHALTAFAQTLGKCPSAQACPTLLTDDYQSILVVQAEALLTLLEGPKAVKGRNSVWERLLRRERNYWVQRKGAIAALLIDRDSDLSALVALASLTSAHNREEGERVLHSLPCLEDASRHDLRKVDYWLQTLYPGQEHWSPLKPDRLADTLLAEQLTKSEDFSKVLPALAQQGSDWQLANSLSVLSRMSYHYPEVASTAIHILIEADSEKLLAIAISVAPQVGDSLGQAIARFLKQQPRDFTQANRLLNLIPQSSVVLAQAAVLLTQQALRGLPADPSDFQKSNERARLLNKLSNRLSDVGSRSAALSAIKEAVRIRRALAEQAPEEFEPDLAKSLNNLSNCLSAMGSRSAALSAIKEAVRIRRALAERAPEEFEPDLAKSLNNLSNQLSDVGDSAAALDAIEEAVRMYRPLAVRSSDTFEPDLAMSLNNLSNRLSDVGDSAAALAAIEEAVKIYRRLAERSPDAFEPDLARSLNNLSNCLSDARDSAAALAAIEEAVKIYQRLAERSPDAFEPDLARILYNLSSCLSEQGDRAAALATIEEAVRMYRGLVERSLDAFEPDLAGSLNNWSSCLSDVERFDDALRAGQQSVELYRRLARQEPQAFQANFVASLDTLARCQNQLNQITQAIETIQEAMELGVLLLKESAQTHTELVQGLRSLYLNLCEQNQIAPDAALLAAVDELLPRPDEENMSDGN